MLALLAPPTALAHAVLVAPAPRIGLQRAAGDDGIKLTPFAQAAAIANDGCGGLRNRLPDDAHVGVEQPLVAYTPGSVLSVQWKLTIPHPNDHLATAQGTGVRIALHYDAGDSFAQNVLAGGLLGDAGVGTLDAAPEDSPAGTQVGASVTLPSGKLCDYCTLQWAWAAENDGGVYVSCVDVAITSDGVLPNYALLPLEESHWRKKLAGVPFPAPAPPPPPALPPSPPPALNDAEIGLIAGLGALGLLLACGAAVCVAVWLVRPKPVPRRAAPVPVFYAPANT